MIEPLDHSGIKSLNILLISFILLSLILRKFTNIYLKINLRFVILMTFNNSNIFYII